MDEPVQDALDLEEAGIAADEEAIHALFYPSEDSGKSEAEDSSDATELEAESAEDVSEDESEDGQSEEADEADGSEVDEEEGEDFPTSIEGLADALDMSVEDVTKLTIKFKASGEDTEATLAELVKGNQLRADYDRGKQALKEAQQKADLDIENIKTQAQRNMQIANGYFAWAKNQNVEALQSEELQQLRKDDPPEYLIRKEELEREIANFDGFQRFAGDEYDKFLNVMHERHLDITRDRLHEDPDWTEERTMNAIGLLKESGFSNKELVNIIDVRSIHLADELKTLREEKKAWEASNERTEKAVRKTKRAVQKLTKPGAPAKREAGRKGKLNELRSRLRKTGKAKDAEAAIAHVLGGIN